MLTMREVPPGRLRAIGSGRRPRRTSLVSLLVPQAGFVHRHPSGVRSRRSAAIGWSGSGAALDGCPTAHRATAALTCHNCDCARKTFTEAIEAVPPRMRTTTRLREAIAAGVEAGRAVDEVATAHGVSWPTAQRAVDAYAARELGEPEPTPLLGVDETRFG